VVISAVLEGAVMSFSKCAVISGATERSSPRVTDVNGLEKGSETKCAGSEVCDSSGCESGGSGGECEVSEAKSGASGESGGCLIASGRSGDCLGTAGGREGSTGSPGGAASLGQ